MEVDEQEIDGRAYFPDESSGSAYEISEEEPSHDEDPEQPPDSTVGSRGGRSRNMAKSHDKEGRRADYGSNQDLSELPTQKAFENAVEWAASFKEPKVEDIKTPPRLVRGGKKRKIQKTATETRVRRLKTYYNNDYRELLNLDIQEAGSRVADSGRLKGSQIGSSIWTAAEKAVLFTALERLGRDNIRGIAGQIGSKSQHEVQEYVNLLHQGMIKKKQNVYRLLVSTDLPVAVEVSDECAAVLERAGDALAVHQELAEEKVEKGKWGDSWLINQNIALQMEKRRRQASGEEEIEEVLPAANLLDLSMWIQLSNRIFMNMGSPREEDNWQTIAESGETPAVRATAFEDFHSLAFNITKRLVSTTLFCSMSRLRARGSNKAKHAEVVADDVEAAINILGLDANSNGFWRGAARRCNLQVINNDDNEPLLMTYNEVEKAFPGRQPEIHSRSVSRTRSQIRSEPSESNYASLPGSDEEFMSSPPSESTSSESESQSEDLPSTKHKPTTYEAQEAAEAAEDTHTEACDMYTSQTEEVRLWDLLGQGAPFEFALIPVSAEAPKGSRDDLAERENWRDHVEYVNEWEEIDAPVTKEAFARNRKRVSTMAKRRAAIVEADINTDDDLDEDHDAQSVEYHTDDEDGEQNEFATPEEQEDEDEGDDEGDDDGEQQQVESQRQHSPNYQSSSEVSHSTMTTASD